jgi:hypothetical protein
MSNRIMSWQRNEILRLKRGENFLKRKRPDRNPASCKIQYPMKNQDKDAGESWIFKTYLKKYFY